MKTLLLTGANGFLGQEIQTCLKDEFQIITLGRSPESTVICDLAKQVPAIPLAIDIVVHCAGKAHIVPRSSSEKEDFFKVNTAGTQHLLKGLEQLPRLPEQIIFISTVAVYGLDSGELITEEAPLLGESPYAKSKIAAEKELLDWGHRHQVSVLILRPPLIVGKNAPGNLAALRNAIQKGYYVRIACNEARKSVVLASDIAQLIPKVRGKSGVYNLSDGVHPKFSAIEDQVAKELKKPIRWSIPLWVLKTAARLGGFLPGFPLNTARLDKMTNSLTFSDALARKELGWQPKGV
ncbi:MAG TPA: NAD-dependent epimerase/dehydratase family protein [Saprospiraceae bacterium]|nr:NAD-dependent epimerase/dehydratase family protein [Saprospiraceae bacterium]HMQ83914.1 NAD-dependent epimerase/dehydratase family protein [Saprospiraceae bacterium]